MSRSGNCIVRTSPKLRPRPKMRIVPPFSVQAFQKNTITAPPPKGHNSQPNLPSPAGATNASSKFRRLYDRGDLPVFVEHTSNGARLAWKTPTEDLDFEKLLPIFCEGLTEYMRPYSLLAEEGVFDLIKHGYPKQIISAIPYMIPSLRKTILLKDPMKIRMILKVINNLVLHVDRAGETLVPFYRQLLSVLAPFFGKPNNLGDRVEYGKKNQGTLSDAIEQTLNNLERTGGRDAFINIKYIIPTYQSCMGNSYVIH